MTIAERLVIAYTPSPDAKEQLWVPPTDKITTIGNKTFIEVGYSDRDFARFCGGDMSASNPLKQFKWLDEALKLRETVVDVELDQIARTKVVTHVPGKRIKNKDALAEFLPDTVTIDVPHVSVGGEEMGPCRLTVAPEVCTFRHMRFECTDEALRYVRLAMIASKTTACDRARPCHADRLSARTGIKGVYATKGNRVTYAYQDEEGRRTTASLKATLSTPVPELANLCKRLKTHRKNAAIESEDHGLLHHGQDRYADLDLSPAGSSLSLTEEDTPVKAGMQSPSQAGESPSTATSSANESLSPAKLNNAWTHIFKTP